MHNIYVKHFLIFVRNQLNIALSQNLYKNVFEDQISILSTEVIKLEEIPPNSI